MIELLTVLLVSTIVAGLAATSFLIIGQKQEIQRDVRRVRATLVQARTLARSSRRCVQVTVGVHAMTTTPYETCGDTLADPDPDDTTTIELVAMVSLNAFSTGDSSLLFNDEGSLDTSGPVDLHVVTSSGDVTYRIYPAIGSVRIVE
jgi:Tfp pilus assembly protein FimT